MRFLKISLLFLSISAFSQNNFITPYEKGNGNQTTTYEECIAFYEKLDERFANIQMIYKGTTDSGKPLHLVLFSSEGKFDFGFAVDWAIKDLGIVQDCAQSLGLNMAATQEILKRYQNISANGHGREDTSALIRQFE